MTIPIFPDFKSLELNDQAFLRKQLCKYPSDASEYTFTNFYIWRAYYRIYWTMHEENLLILYNPMGWGYYFLQPIGPAPRGEITRIMLEWLRDEKDEPEARIDRADLKYIEELVSMQTLEVETVRDQYDYVYLSSDLIQLTGRKYHKKKNHLNKFINSNPFTYEKMTNAVTDECIHVLKKWCNWRECEKNLIMRAEYEAVYESLIHFEQLGIQGGLIRVNNTVEAFAMGENLTDDTAIIHVEKANPNLQGSFAVINQQFAEHEWADVKYINREQDLGVEGLRLAKESYRPHHMVEKFRIRLKRGAANE